MQIMESNLFNNYMLHISSAAILLAN